MRSLITAPRARAWVLRGYGTAVALIAIGCLTAAVRWVGHPFPGFFVMSNRVVPSIGLDHWSGMTGAAIFQHEVTAVDGSPVERAADLYARVRAQPEGHPFTYELRRGAVVETRTFSSMIFGWRDFVQLFGPLLVNGVVFSTVGLLVAVLGASTPAAAGTVLFVLDVGLFCLTALDLYGPGRCFRLHVATEALMPITLLHLLLVFPVARLGARRPAALRTLYGLGAVLVALYQAVLYRPTAYTLVHNGCMAAVGAAGVVMIASCVHSYVTSTSPLVRRRLGVLALGIVCGFALPAWVMMGSVFTGGARPLNLAVFTAFLFPLALAYAVIKHDLFEIDALLRRGLSYVVLTSIVLGLFGVLGLASGLVLRRFDLEHSPIFPLAFTAIMIFVFHPLRERTQRTVDRMYSRSNYDARATLEHASAALAATLDLQDIGRLTLDTVCRTFSLTDASVWIRQGHRFEVAVSAGVGALTLPDDHALVQRLRTATRGVSVHDFSEPLTTDPAGRTCARTLALLQANVVLPIGAPELVGFVALGPKPSRALFTLEDLAFVTTLLNQVAVAIRNAQAYRQIEALNEGLEEKVAHRTNELASANERLGLSLQQLEAAYRDLQRSQDELVRAERMATLGQLAAGIAHEVNSPLGAALNGLKISRELAEEYAASIGDPTVEEPDHRALATDLQEQLRNVERWAGTAAAFIRTIKNHTHDAAEGREAPFDLRLALEDVQRLLAHRLRSSSCTLVIACPEGLTLHGDVGKLAQVVTNLVANAIDATDEAGRDDATVRITVSADDEIRLSVEDDGCGIPDDRRERIFDALFTTKPRGKGTGLGLALCRGIVEGHFGGTITVQSTPGAGSRFTITLPSLRPQTLRDDATAA